MKYISTRGGISPISFKEAVLMGLATDGGLIVSESIPNLSQDALGRLINASYQEVAFEVMSPFISDIPEDDLKMMIDDAYSRFSHPEITPLVRVGDKWVMELFHGPTLAFKDIALQLLGNFFSYILKERGETIKIIGATSGDTGSAAIHGVRGRPNISIYILHPHKRVSRVQELQMTTVTDDNVVNVAVEGTFDDCQAIVKAIFNDLEFRKRHNLAAVNSINWARVLAQVVYYVYAFLKLMDKAEKVYFSVPTGNFGDIFAGFIARKMVGDGIGRLILATNENDILTRFIQEGRYVRSKSVTATSSPSMDIQVASNFERYLYYLFGCDSQKVKDKMEAFEQGGDIEVTPQELTKAREEFSSMSVDRKMTTETIKKVYEKYRYVLDPHTAVGFAAAQKNVEQTGQGEVVCLATAHPAKFPETVQEAIGTPPLVPESIKKLEGMPQKLVVSKADVENIKQIVSR